MYILSKSNCDEYLLWTPIFRINILSVMLAKLYNYVPYKQDGSTPKIMTIIIFVHHNKRRKQTVFSFWYGLDRVSRIY